MNEKQREILERIKSTPHLFTCDVLQKDFVDLVSLVEELSQNYYELHDEYEYYFQEYQSKE